MRTIPPLLIVAACLLMLLPAAAQAGNCDSDGCGPQACVGSADCCADCGGCRPCQKKVCQVVCGTEKVKKYCWACVCEEFCAPLPGGRACSSCCDSGCDGCCGRPPAPPRCGPVRTRKKLMMKEYVCEVPVYKCVVKYLCHDCCNGCGEGDEEAGLPDAPIPAETATAPAPVLKPLKR